MYIAEAFCVRLQTLASRGPHKDIQPYNCLRGKLIEIDFEYFQHLYNEAAQRKSQSSFQKASVYYDFILFRVWASFFPFVDPHNDFVFIGVSVVTTKVMNTLLLLDQPKRRRAKMCIRDRHGSKGGFSFAKENPPFGPPRERPWIGSLRLEQL